MDPELVAERRRDHKTVYCPNGHRMSWSGKSDIERAKEATRKAEAIAAAERKRHRQTRADLEHTERRRTAQVGATTRLRNKAKAGECVCCGKPYKALAKHMARMHPEFVAEDGEEE